MKSLLNIESTLTDRYQTTIPGSIRQALRLSKRDKLLFEIQADGSVRLSKASSSDEDPIVGEFLNFLANDMLQKPEHLLPLTSELSESLKSLVSGVEFDLDAPLSDDDE
ncbi:type II toxin-antitoxin system PrlF family antitoxin [Myxococcota bacterium]|nr:type II toxin-antitoxin system PrlF family antitoxin [Myxococcota bacterium]